MLRALLSERPQHHSAALSFDPGIAIHPAAHVAMGQMTKSRTTAGIVLRIVCAMILVAIGFAHKPLNSALASGPDMAAYELPDGTVASLCLPDEDGKTGKHHDNGCEACRITSSIAVPQPPRDCDTTMPAAEAAVFVFTPESLHRLIFPPSAPPRGPPAVPVSVATA